MIHRFWLVALLLQALWAGPAGAVPPYKPYGAEATNVVYNQLFGDDPAAYDPLPGQAPTRIQYAITSAPPDVPGLKAIAEDAKLDPRMRYLAYRRLHQAGQKPPARRLLGVIVEVGRPAGLDTLAAYTNGGARLINAAGRLFTLENDPAIAQLSGRLLAVADPMAAALPATDLPRAAPPTRGNVRITFLAADGPRFREGPFNILQQEAGAGAVLQQAVALLRAIAAQASP